MVKIALQFRDVKGKQVHSKSLQFEILSNVPVKLKTRTNLEPSLSVKFSLFHRYFSPYNDRTVKNKERDIKAFDMFE